MWKSAYIGIYQLLNWKMHGETLKWLVMLFVHLIVTLKNNHKQKCTVKGGEGQSNTTQHNTAPTIVGALGRRCVNLGDRWRCGKGTALPVFYVYTPTFRAMGKPELTSTASKYWKTQTARVEMETKLSTIYLTDVQCLTHKEKDSNTTS